MIVDMSPVSYVDASALHILEDMRQDYETRGITFCLCNPSQAVMHRLVLAELADKIGHENIFVSTHDAVREALSRLSQMSDIVDIEKNNELMGVRDDFVSDDRSMIKDGL